MIASKDRSTAADKLHQYGWKVIRWLNSASGQPVLNAQSNGSGPADPARELFKIARKLKAEGIDESGKRVDYASLAGSDCYHQLRHLTGSLSACRLNDLGNRQDRFAFWINLYNALILDAIIRLDVKDRVPFSLFQRAAYDVCGHRFSADDIEHGVLRNNRPHPIYRLRPFSANDPRLAAAIDPFDARIHFALNCGARSCPPITFYAGDQIEQQLEQAAASFIRGGGAQVNPETQELELSSIFKWYQSDFGGKREMLNFVADHWTDQGQAQAMRSAQLRIRYRDYDWSVNSLL